MTRSVVMIVEDDVDLQAMVATTLDLEGYTVLCAENGQVALDLLDQHCPGLILLDLRMPVMDGWTFLAQLRIRGLTIPTVIVSANVAGSPRPCDLNIVAQIDKPFELDELLATVQAILTPRRRGELKLEWSRPAMSRRPLRVPSLQVS